MPVQVQCPACKKTANVPEAAIGKSVRCDCGQLFQLSPLSVVNLNDIALQTPAEPTPAANANQPKLQEFHCKNCGAAIRFEASSQKLHCDFCGSDYLTEKPLSSEVTEPDSIFVAAAKVSAQMAKQSFFAWLSDSLFTANSVNDIKQFADSMKITCVYVPFWHFNISLTSQWEGEYSQLQYRRVHKVKTVYLNGRSQEVSCEEDEPYTAWFRASGSHSENYVAKISASNMLSVEEANWLTPSLNDFSKFNPEFLAGWRAQVPDVLESKAQVWALNLVVPMENIACRGLVERLTNCSVQVTGCQSALLYFPLWIVHYFHEGKKYRAIINGQTGQIYGKRPISTKKVLVFAGSMMGIVLACLLVWWIWSAIQLSREIGSHIEAAKQASKSENYESAASEFRQVLALDEGNATAKDGLTDAVFSQALKQAKDSAAKGDWSVAVQKLREGLQNLGKREHGGKECAKKLLGEAEYEFSMAEAKARRKQVELAQQQEQERLRKLEEDRQKTEEALRKQAEDQRRQAEETARKREQERITAAVVEQYNLGLAYDNGQGVTKDVVEAFKHFRKSAEQSYASAQFRLGFAYEKGRGITTDYDEAVKWYRKAADQGNVAAQQALRIADEKRNNIQQKLKTDEQKRQEHASMPLWDGKESSADYAKRVGLEPTLTLDLGSVKQELLLVPAGTFTMGSPETEKNREPNETQHEVTISHSFYMGKYHVTVGQFSEFVKATAYKTEAEKSGKVLIWNGRKSEERQGASWKDPGFNQTDDHPVVLVSWNDAQEFVKWVGGQTGKAVRLPTEAEWEYACRAGTKTVFCNGNWIEELKKVGWCSYDGNYGSTRGTKPAGSFQPNAWGLYDMHGNAWQWCRDLYGDYPTSVSSDPQGANTQSSNRVLRGGSWLNIPSCCRSAYRNKYSQGFYDNDSGFRVLVPAFGAP